jgi:hypothetical protein
MRLSIKKEGELGMEIFLAGMAGAPRHVKGTHGLKK